MSRVVVAGCCAALLLLGPAPPVRPSVPTAAGPARPAVSYAAPVAPPVVLTRAFQAPAGPYAAGHRGVDLAAVPGQTVRAAGPGRVLFAGSVGIRGVIVIEHPDGVSTEYEPVIPVVAAGEQVARGEVIGTVIGRHGSCRASRCLHWGARRAGNYFDPMTLLARLGPVRLLPWPLAVRD
jgi:murein DD-endopeptidase MepM/ murein hydrolase activator NlpD